ncbi:MAG: hypothetical protein AB1705_26960 [Verrucomicrobiota bacterium]
MNQRWNQFWKCLAAWMLLAIAAPATPAADYRLAPIATQVRTNVARLNPKPATVSRDDYLALIHANINYFRRFQEPDGRIIDEFSNREAQYSTASYAWASAALVASGKSTNLLASASMALTQALLQLTSEKGAAHGDSITLPAMLAYEQLRDRTSPGQRAEWERLFKLVIPDKAYRDIPSDNRNYVQCWNAGALTGEFLRSKAGFTDLGFVQRFVPRHLSAFDADGLYHEPFLAMAYEHLARQFFSILLHRGYQTPEASLLQQHLERGAWTSLLVQSSLGEMPTGERGCQHQWNEAEQCVTYEIWAARKKKEGDLAAAQMFKRAARLSLEAVRRYVRPSGDLNIVKNAMDPAARHGFDGYSSHAHFNLLTASLLATAWLVADDSIPATTAPAEVGGYVFDLPAYRKIFANAGGLYLQIETGAETNYTSTGLVRIHRAGMEGIVGPSDGAAIRNGALAVGIAWKDGTNWQSLASFDQSQNKSASLLVQESTPQRVRFSVRYAVGGAAKAVVEHYELTPDKVRVTAEVEGDVNELRVRFPALIFTGVRVPKVTIDGAQATVTVSRSQETFVVESPAGVKLHRSGELISSRNGFLEAIEGDIKGKKVVYTLSPKPL